MDKQSNVELSERAKILEAAKNCVCGQRETDYGSPEANIGNIAKLWSHYLGIDVSPTDVCCMMIMLKISRSKKGNGSLDNWVDMAGYAAVGGELDNHG